MLIEIGFFIGVIGLILWELTPSGPRHSTTRTVFQVITYFGTFLSLLGFVLRICEVLA